MEITDSIIEYLKENRSLVIEYCEGCRRRGTKPNYSEFCRRYLNGTTTGGHSFSSIKADRERLTEYIRSNFTALKNVSG